MFFSQNRDPKFNDDLILLQRDSDRVINDKDLVYTSEEVHTLLEHHQSDDRRHLKVFTYTTCSPLRLVQKCSAKLKKLWDNFYTRPFIPLGPFTE